MRVSEVMTACVTVCLPSDSLKRVARTMAELDVGWIPVGERDRLVGIVTDRDIVVRGLADGLRGGAAVSKVMSAPVRYCQEHESLGMAAFYMADLQLRRLPVLNAQMRLVGVLSLGDMSRKGPRAAAAACKVLAGVSSTADASQSATVP